MKMKKKQKEDMKKQTRSTKEHKKDPQGHIKKFKNTEGETQSKKDKQGDIKRQTECTVINKNDRKEDQG